MHAVEGEEQLEVHRLLRPQRAVVVEGGDALGGGDEARPALLRHARDEVEDGLLRAALVPRGQGVGRLRHRRRRREHEAEHRENPLHVVLLSSITGAVLAGRSERCAPRARGRARRFPQQRASVAADADDLELRLEQLAHRLGDARVILGDQDSSAIRGGDDRLPRRFAPLGASRMRSGILRSDVVGGVGPWSYPAASRPRPIMPACRGRGTTGRRTRALGSGGQLVQAVRGAHDAGALRRVVWAVAGHGVVGAGPSAGRAPRSTWISICSTAQCRWPSCAGCSAASTRPGRSAPAGVSARVRRCAGP